MSVDTDVYIVAGKGDTWRNGKRLAEGVEEKLSVFDRVALGDQLMMFRFPGREDECGEPMNADDAVNEFQEGMVASRSGGGGGGVSPLGCSNFFERYVIQEIRLSWMKNVEK
jgi:hypothetical protein